MSIAAMRACRGDGVRELEKEKKDEREETPWDHCSPGFCFCFFFFFAFFNVLVFVLSFSF